MEYYRNLPHFQPDGAELFIRAAHRSKLQLYRAVAMVAEGDGRVGRNIHGIDVLGTFDDIPKVVPTELASGLDQLTPRKVAGGLPGCQVLSRSRCGCCQRELVTVPVAGDGELTIMVAPLNVSPMRVGPMA